MRLKQHINESRYLTPSRSVSIDFDKGIELINKECKNALVAYRSGHMFYRGNDSDALMLLVQPSKFVRVSANTMNLYTIIIDNSRLWDDYPKRGKSIICSTSYSTANSYSDNVPYIVFPKDGYKIGICPESDIWQSFKNIGPLYLFNADFADFVKSLGVKFRSDDLKTSLDLRKLCNELDEIISKMDDKIKVISFLRNYSGNLMKSLENMFDPKRNDFKVVNDIRELPKGNNEVWTDSDCYLVNHSSNLDALLK
jgi:hypothetical protein